jgi:hypothetical protein
LGGVEDLVWLEVYVGKLAVELFYLLLGKRLEDVHQGKEADSFFHRRPTFAYFVYRPDTEYTFWAIRYIYYPMTEAVTRFARTNLVRSSVAEKTSSRQSSE